VSEGFLADAVCHWSYLVNMSPSIVVDLQIPEEIWWEESVNFSTLRIFGFLTYNLVDSQKKNKLKSKSKRFYFISFTKGTKTYKLWHPEKRMSLLAKMWSLMRIQCCNQTQKQITRRKEDLQTVHQILRERSLSFQMTPTSPLGKWRLLCFRRRQAWSYLWATSAT